MSDERGLAYSPRDADGEYSVAVWGADGETYWYDKRYVAAEVAIPHSKKVIDSVGGRIGMISKVMVTDGGDCCVVLWEYGKGIVFPTKEDMAQ